LWTWAIFERYSGGDRSTEWVRAYRRAAQRVRDTRLPATATDGLVEALEASAAAYADLAAAIAAGDQDKYDDARAEIVAAEAGVWPGRVRLA
jgi:hypothetical protein